MNIVAGESPPRPLAGRLLPRVAVSRLAAPGRVAPVALALGVVADLLLYGRPPGISVPIVTLALLAALVGLGAREGVHPARRNLWLVAPTLFFAAMVAVRANPFVTTLDLLAVLTLLGLFAYFYAAGALDRLGLLGYPFVLAHAVACALALPPLVARGTPSRRGPGGRTRRHALAVGRGLLFAFPVLLVFGALLSSADLVFARYVGALASPGALSDLFWQALVVASVSWVAAGGLIYALARPRGLALPAALEGAPETLPRVVSIGVVEAATVLGLVDLLFLVFGLIQLTYLFGGRAAVARAGYTYAAYARRGFFELVVVSALTLGLILGLH